MLVGFETTFTVLDLPCLAFAYPSFVCYRLSVTILDVPFTRCGMSFLLPRLVSQLDTGLSEAFIHKCPAAYVVIGFVYIYLFVILLSDFQISRAVLFDTWSREPSASIYTSCV